MRFHVARYFYDAAYTANFTALVHSYPNSILFRRILEESTFHNHIVWARCCTNFPLTDFYVYIYIYIYIHIRIHRQTYKYIYNKKLNLKFLAWIVSCQINNLYIYTDLRRFYTHTWIQTQTHTDTHRHTAQKERRKVKEDLKAEAQKW